MTDLALTDRLCGYHYNIAHGIGLGSFDQFSIITPAQLFFKEAFDVKPTQDTAFAQVSGRSGSFGKTIGSIGLTSSHLHCTGHGNGEEEISLVV